MEHNFKTLANVATDHNGFLEGLAEENQVIRPGNRQSDI